MKECYEKSYLDRTKRFKVKIVVVVGERLPGNGQEIKSLERYPREDNHNIQ